MKEKIQKFKNLINSSSKILLVNHIRMDPDAFGSLGALYYVLKRLGKEVKATNDTATPKDFNFLGDEEIIEVELNIEEFNPDLIISLDVGGIDRLGLIYTNNKEIFNNTTFITIDHHISNTGFGDLDIIDSKSSSTCELLYEILSQTDLKKYITPEIATFLLTGIITDTNIYYNTNTTSKTLKIASELLESGANFRKPIYEFYRKRKFNKTKLWGEILKDIKQTKDSKIVWVIIKRNLFEKTATSDKDTSGVINEFLSNIDGVEVCFILYELENLEVKASFRSNSFDVSKLCTSFSGGGHKQAAGFISNKNIEIVEKEILEKLTKEI